MLLYMMITGDDPRVISKNKLTEYGAVNVSKPTNIVSVISPVFEIDYRPEFLNCNYCYCDILHRFYYIRDITIVAGKKMRISCEVDVLTTYKDTILNCTGFAVRSESAGINYVPDDKLPLHPSKVYYDQPIYFPNNPFNTSLSGYNFVVCINNTEG